MPFVNLSNGELGLGAKMAVDINMYSIGYTSLTLAPVMT